MNCPSVVVVLFIVLLLSVGSALRHMVNHSEFIFHIYTYIPYKKLGKYFVTMTYIFKSISVFVFGLLAVNRIQMDTEMDME